MVCLYTFSNLFFFFFKKKPPPPPPPPPPPSVKKSGKPNAPLKTHLNGLQIFRLTIFKRKWAMGWGRLRPLRFSPSPRQAKGSDWPQTSKIQANYFMVSELFLQTFFLLTRFISNSFQLAKKRSQQNDLVERFKPPVHERPKVTFKNLQKKDSLNENVEEETMERKSEENRKDEDCGSNKIKEIKIDLNDDDTSALISDAPPSEMESAWLNQGYEGDKEEEESDDFNASFPENEGQKEPVTSVMVLPSISIAHFAKGKEHTITEPPRNTITIEKEEDTCEGKEVKRKSFLEKKFCVMRGRLQRGW